jgi:hypothetical protein
MCEVDVTQHAIHHGARGYDDKRPAMAAAPRQLLARLKTLKM